MKTKEEVLAAFTTLMHQAHEAGFWISGCISVDADLPCPSCRTKMSVVLTDRERGIYARKCPKCAGAGSQHVTITPIAKSPLAAAVEKARGGAAPIPLWGNPRPLATPIQSDAPMCTHCGGIMSRKGSCYYCNDCGESSGCS